MKQEYLETISAFGPCENAYKWLSDNADKSPQQLWAECERGDWMLWLAARLGVDSKLLVKAACACARLALPYVPAGENRPLAAIETAEKWADGKATIEDVKAARGAAYAAYAAAYASYATADAAYAVRAAYAAHAAVRAADAAVRAVYTTRAKEYAVYVATLQECASLVRGIIPVDLLQTALERKGGK